MFKQDPVRRNIRQVTLPSYGGLFGISPFINQDLFKASIIGVIDDDRTTIKKEIIKGLNNKRSSKLSIIIQIVGNGIYIILIQLS